MVKVGAGSLVRRLSDGHLDLACHGEKWSDSGSNLKVEPLGLLTVRIGVRKERLVFGQSKCLKE